MPLDAWESVLKRTGFSGLDVAVRDCEDDENHAFSVIMSTKERTDKPSFPADISLVYADAPPPKAWVKSLSQSVLKLTGISPKIESLKTLNPAGKVCIFLTEIERPVLLEMSEERFTQIKKMLNSCKGVLWVSRGGVLDCAQPEFGLHTGLLRTLRLEDNGKRYISLDVDPGKRGQKRKREEADSAAEPWSASAAKAILDVFQVAFDYSIDKLDIDFEYAQRESKILVPRNNDNAEQNQAVTFDVEEEPELQPFKQPGRQLRMNVEVPGLLDSLIFRDDPSADDDLPDDFVEIEPAAFGLNFRDIMVSMGQLQEKIMGFECSGVITRVGYDAASRFNVGDRVCALTTRGHWANFIRMPWTGVGRIPDAMSFEDAASIPMVFVTAWYSLVESARLQKGETILIHAASGGVGQAAIIISKYIGAEIYATVGSQEKRDFITNTYGIPPDHIFSSRDVSFATDLKIATNGRGVDVLLNSLSGEILQESWNSIATMGRFVEIGKRDIQLNKHLEMEPFGQAISFSAIDLIQLGNHKGLTLSKVMNDLLRLLDSREIQPIQPITVYPMAQIQRAFRFMQGGKHLGKIVVKPGPGDLVKVSGVQACVSYPDICRY